MTDLLEKFLALKDIKATEILDDEGDFEDYADLTKAQKKQVKEAAELFTLIKNTLDKTDEHILYEFSKFIGDTSYWTASSFRC